MSKTCYDQHDIVEIGSLLYDTKTKQIIKRLNKEGFITVIPSATIAMSIDPHCERYYWISPYAYCLNNPLRFIDPDGKDVWELDEQGKILRIITHDADGNRLTYDRIDVLDSKGNLKTQTNIFELGTITQQTMNVNYTDGTSHSYNVFTVNGDKNAENVFGTLANPDNSTKVEWSLSTFQNKDSSSLNFVSTSHDEAIEYSSGYLFVRPSQQQACSL